MKSRYFIIVFLFLAILNTSYGSGLCLINDTGKRFSKTGFNQSPIGSKLKKIDVVKGGTDLYQKQFFINYDRLPIAQRDSVFADAKLIRTGWEGGIFGTTPGFYRHDLTSAIPAGFIALTTADRENFILNIDPDSIKRWRDSVCYYAGNIHRCLYAVVPVTLNNKSADTLNYINMACTWLDIFKAEAKNVLLLRSDYMDCFMNRPYIHKIAPYQQEKFYLPVCFLTDLVKNELFAPKTLKIGMGLYKYIDGGLFPVDLHDLMFNPKTSNIIWTNEITVR